jgi:hypothetical protein
MSKICYSEKMDLHILYKIEQYILNITMDEKEAYHAIHSFKEFVYQEKINRLACGCR